MKWEFTCPNCQTNFVAEDNGDLKIVLCPGCDTPLPVPKPSSLPPRTPDEGAVSGAGQTTLALDAIAAAADEARVAPPASTASYGAYDDDPYAGQPPAKPVNWLLWGLMGFGFMWLCAIILMVVLYQSKRPAATVATAPVPVTTRATQPTNVASAVAPSPAPVTEAPPPVTPVATQPAPPPKPPRPKLAMAPKPSTLTDEQILASIRK